MTSWKRLLIRVHPSYSDESLQGKAVDAATVSRRVAIDRGPVPEKSSTRACLAQAHAAQPGRAHREIMTV